MPPYTFIGSRDITGSSMIYDNGGITQNTIQATVTCGNSENVDFVNITSEPTGEFSSPLDVIPFNRTDINYAPSGTTFGARYLMIAAAGAATTAFGGVISAGGSLGTIYRTAATSTMTLRRRYTDGQIQEVRSDYDAYKERRERRRAEVKARRLFKLVVGEIAYRRFRELGYHQVRGKSMNWYRLRPGLRVQSMFTNEKGELVVDHELCAHLPYGIPWYDTLVTQHLMLTSCLETEEQFRKVANRHQVRGPYPIPELDRADAA